VSNVIQQISCNVGILKKNAFIAVAANRHKVNGTWFVQAICKQLDLTDELEPLVIFFTKVQNALCERSKIQYSSHGQTPQLHLFGHSKIVICPNRRKLKAAAINRSPL
jgi:hypothetical protein